MKALIQQLALLAVGVAVIHTVLVLISFALYPALDQLDTLNAPNTIYRRSHRLTAFGLSEPALHDGPRLIVLGGSNCKQGFRPAELSREIAEYRIHNLALDGTNVTEIRLVAGTITAALKQELPGSTVFIVGVCYPVFIDNTHRNQWFGRPGDQNTAYAVGLRREIARWTPDFIFPPQANLPPSIMLTREYSMVLRPCFLLDTAKTTLQELDPAELPQALGAILNGNWEMLKPDPEPRFFLNPRSDQLNVLHTMMGWQPGNPNREQFDELRQMAQDISASGAHLIVVDMPLPDWHRQASGEDADYRRFMPEYVSQLKEISGMYYVDLHDAPLQFIDQGHPLPNQTQAWSDTLADAIRPILDELRNPTQGQEPRNG